MNVIETSIPGVVIIEPRVFGDRVYIYGSHDRFGIDKFCDFKLKAGAETMEYWPPVFSQGKGFK